MTFRLTLAFLCLSLSLSAAQAETVSLRNGDKLNGEVISLNKNELKFRSESFGELTLQRNQIASIQFVAEKKQIPTAPSLPTPGVPAPKTNSSKVTSLLERVTSPNSIIQQLQAAGGIPAADMKAIEKQIPLAGSPEVKKFVNDKVTGLLTGRLNIGDIRKEAINAVDQVKDIQKDLGPQAGALNGYLSILENFIDETAPAEEKPKVESTPSRR